MAWLLLLALLPICTFIPGFFFVRKLPWTPLEKLNGSLALSLLFFYLSMTVFFLCKLPPATCWLLAGFAPVLAWLSRADLKRLWEVGQVRRACGGFAFLLGLGLLLLGMVRHYSGGNWAGDWFEHFERSLFFLADAPAWRHLYGGKYLLPARPPLMNLVAAFFLGLCGQSFACFQVVFLFLNLLAFFPCYLLAGQLGPAAARQRGWVAVFLAGCPALLQNATYSWTKLLTVFFILLALHFYLRAWRKNEPARMLAAFLCLSLGLLTHYSAAPYLAFFVVHYLAIFLHRARPWREVSTIAVCCALVLLTWFAWSLAFYGLHGTVASNSSVLDAQAFHGENAVKKMAHNTLTSIVPHPLYLSPTALQDYFWQPYFLGYDRDYWFFFYQTNLLGALGLVGGVVVVTLFGKSLVRGPRSLRWFWLTFSLGTFLLGVAAVGSLELYGVAHICSLPLVLLGGTLLAGSFTRLPYWVRLLVALGLVIDTLLGILLQHWMESYFFAFGQDFVALVPLPELLHETAVECCFAKRDITFVGDHLQGGASFFLAAAALLFCWRAFVPVAAHVIGTGKGARAQWAGLWGSLVLILLGTFLLLAWQKNSWADNPRLQTRLEELVAANPESPYFRRNLGQLYFFQGHSAKAYPYFVDCLLLEEKKGFLNIYLLDLLVQSQGHRPVDLDGISRLCFDASAAGQMRLGAELAKRGFPNAARKRFTEARRLDPAGTEKQLRSLTIQ